LSMIDVYLSPQQVALQIVACVVVISSSLHVLFFSAALGVPFAHIRLSDRLTGGMYKFLDYYSAYSGEYRYREYTVPADGPRSVRSVVDTVIDGYVEPFGLGNLQNGLIRALHAFRWVEC